MIPTASFSASQRIRAPSQRSRLPPGTGPKLPALPDSQIRDLWNEKQTYQRSGEGLRHTPPASKGKTDKPHSKTGTRLRTQPYWRGGPEPTGLSLSAPGLTV